MKNKLNNSPENVDAYKEFLQLRKTMNNMSVLVRRGEVDYFNLRKSSYLTNQMIRDITGQRSVKGDQISVADHVVAYYGTPATPANDRELLFASKGHIVIAALTTLADFIASISYSNSTTNYGMSAEFSTALTTYMRLGTGAGATAYSTSALSTVINTAPSNQGTVLHTGPTSDTRRIMWTSTWNANALSAADVSELGLFLNLASTSDHVTGLFSRLSDADGDFTTFTLNTAVPLTIEWHLDLTFA